MIFKSKMIHDPNGLLPGNLQGYTIGLTIHSTKRHKCDKNQFYSSPYDHMRFRDGKAHLSDEVMEMRFRFKYAHRNCTEKTKHVSNVGYMYWTGPKRRYTFRYAGPVWYRDKWWKPFSVGKNRSRYVRWIDNGPKGEPHKPFTGEERARLNEAMGSHRDEMVAAAASAEAQMNEYERMRGGIHATSRKRWFASNRADRLR